MKAETYDAHAAPDLTKAFERLTETWRTLEKAQRSVGPELTLALEAALEALAPASGRPCDTATAIAVLTRGVALVRRAERMASAEAGL